MASPKQYLEWHGQQWRVRIKVPAKVRNLVGRSKLIFPLHTSSLERANEMKWPIITRFKALIREAEKALTTNDPLDAEALQIRLQEDAEGREFEAEERATQIEGTHGRKIAKAFYDIASGQLTPLTHHQDAFLRHQAYRKKSEGDFQRVLGWLEGWLRSSNLPIALEHISRKAAGEFISDSLTVGRSPAKAAAYLGFLRKYWRWLHEKGHAPENPWIGQTLPSAPRVPRDNEPDYGKRPFTDDEILTLFDGNSGEPLGDLMLISTLSGMRLEEICQLFIRDCKGGMFSIWEGKTDAARRTVPIHSKLVKVIQRLGKGKKPDDYLIAGLPPIPPSRETRSDPLSKRFTRYRRKLNVDERPNGKAKSNIDFHSFRRWFIRKARDAMLAGSSGFDEWTLIAVVGHTDSERPKSLDLAMRGYAGPDPENAKRALVEAVQLPNHSNF